MHLSLLTFVHTKLHKVVFADSSNRQNLYAAVLTTDWCTIHDFIFCYCFILVENILTCKHKKLAVTYMSGSRVIHIPNNDDKIFIII